MWKNYSKELIVEGDCMKGKVRAGYSLIELMIAMAISAIVLTAIIGLIGFATRNMRITQTSVDLQNQAKETLNHMTTYVMEDNDYTSSSVSETNTNYQNNEKITTTTPAVGTVNYDGSSISAVATNYVIYDEDTLRASGTLGDMTFDEYVAANSEPVKAEVDQDLYTLISNATGVPVSNITIIAYDQPMFQYSKGSTRTISDYLQIILAVLIFALLGYVVFRSTRKEKAVEPEPELSVESLLESTKESADTLQDIGFNEKSETRVLIEKFVEENPEAAASLLRNWLNEEWE